jgi:hypothetical protein
MLRSFSFACAGAALLAFGGIAKADDDLIRLGGKGDAETVEARYGYGGFYRGGWGGGWNRGWGGWGGGWNRGYYGGWGRGYYGGWGRGWYGGGWGVGWNRGYYRPWYGGYGYRPFVGIGVGWGGYYPGYYGGYSVPYYSSYSYCPCSTNLTAVGGTVLTLGSSLATTAVPDNGTYPYDGGPRDGSLAPSANAPAQMNGPGRSTLPRDGKLVSLPTPTADPYQFVAFGETPADASPAPTGGVFVSQPPPASRVIFPAYGETMPRSFSGDVSTFRVSMK